MAGSITSTAMDGLPTSIAMALVILLNKTKWTLPLALMGFQGEFGSDYGPLNAAIVTTVVPAVVV
ncbi:hypothetical protein [Bradyrhizobium sp. USDA 336]|uniref:hypothetical protein n=1 Tax=Bradyrhizobium sp. USDA 336 TaxID=3156311 RepID=UPI0038399277